MQLISVTFLLPDPECGTLYLKNSDRTQASDSLGANWNRTYLSRLLNHGALWQIVLLRLKYSYLLTGQWLNIVPRCWWSRSLRSWENGPSNPHGGCVYVYTCKTHHCRSENLWQRVRSTSFRRLAEPRVRTREICLVTRIDHVTERQQGHAEPDRRAINCHNDDLRKCDQSTDKITAMYTTNSQV